MDAAHSEILSTATLGSMEDAETYIQRKASDRAYTLLHLSTALGAMTDTIVLDPETRTIWWAYHDTVDDHCTVEHLTPVAAAARASESAHWLLDRMDHITGADFGYRRHLRLYDPEVPEYLTYYADLEGDQKALDEYADILLLTVPSDPFSRHGDLRAARAEIRRHRRRTARQEGLWLRAEARLVGKLVQRGDASSAVAALGIGTAEIEAILTEDAVQRGTVREALHRARTPVVEEHHIRRLLDCPDKNPVLYVRHGEDKHGPFALDVSGRGSGAPGIIVAHARTVARLGDPPDPDALERVLRKVRKEVARAVRDHYWDYL
ncbi:hypothetical protein [Streptomyces sp. NBC_00690]|uniref:hypothetical protein n=1 Tax=Streptomyces sp. NBC_00690 TaxID=2975808 RepID=UPI002E2A46C4|nr:hypothetical protein [Streptomyces sp. NBC_00690]